MTSTQELAAAPSSLSSANLLGRVAVFGYGMASYAIGVAGLLAMILATLGVLPLTGGPLHLDGRAGAIAFDVVLVALFGIQHAIMARPAFKQWWTTVIPKAAERSTFVLLSGLLMANAIWLWQPLDGALWTVESPTGRWLLLGGCALGWAYMLTASFAIDHFELFGVKQVWRNLRGLDTQEPKLVQRLMYRFDRHPLMTGVVLGLWCTPDMTFGRLALALGFSVYIVIGVAMEERDLIGRHGGRYVDFARRVRTIVPRLARYR